MLERKRKCENSPTSNRTGHNYWWGNGSHQQCLNSREDFFFLIISEPLYFLWDKLTQQRLANPAAFINFLWQTLIPGQLGPTPLQGQTSPCLAAWLPSIYTGTLFESPNGKAWQGLGSKLSQLSAQLVQTVKVKSGVLFSLGRT